MTAGNRDRNEELFHPLEVLESHFDYFSKPFRKAAQQVFEIVKKVVKVEIENGAIVVDSNVNEFIANNILNYSLARQVYLWTIGKNLLEIISETAAQEGRIVATLLRLDNLLKSVKAAAKIVGHMPLSEAIEKCQTQIRRDIVFTNSLYLEEE